MNFSTDAEEHQQALMTAFIALLAAEDEERTARAAIKAAQEANAAALRHAEQAQAEAWAEIARLMAETGEVEVVLPDETHDYKIGYGTSRESVKADPDACPDEFVKVERKPKLKEIGDHLKALRDKGAAAPNWARLEKSEPKLSWTLVKKGAA